MNIRLFICLIITALVAIYMGSTIQHHPPMPVKLHIFNLAEPIVCFEDKWQVDPQLTKLTGYGPWEGQIYDCIGKPLDYGDVAIPWDSDLRYNDEVLIWKDSIGWIEGRHLVKDICPIPGTADLYLPNKYLANKLTGPITIYRRKR